MTEDTFQSHAFLIGKEVYIETKEKYSPYNYSTDREWVVGKVVATFPGGDLLVKYDDDKLQRNCVEQTAFTDGSIVSEVEEKVSGLVPPDLGIVNTDSSKKPRDKS